MKIKIAALAAATLCLVVSCDHKTGGSTSKQQAQKIQELNYSTKDETKRDIPAPAPVERMQYSPPVVKSDEEVKTGTVSNGDIKDKELIGEKPFNTEDYDNIVENKFLAATQNPLSTFSISAFALSPCRRWRIGKRIGRKIRNAARNPNCCQ